MNESLSDWSECLWAVAPNVAFSCNMWLGGGSIRYIESPALHLQGKKANALRESCRELIDKAEAANYCSEASFLLCRR